MPRTRSSAVTSPNETRRSLEGSAGIIVGTVGKGRVVLIADQLNFRGYWYGTNKLFANAVFFAPVVDAEAGKIERPDEAPTTKEPNGSP